MFTFKDSDKQLKPLPKSQFTLSFALHQLLAATLICQMVTEWVSPSLKKKDRPKGVCVRQISEV